MPLLQKLIDQNANQNKGKKVFQIEKKQTFFFWKIQIIRRILFISNSNCSNTK